MERCIEGSRVGRARGCQDQSDCGWGVFFSRVFCFIFSVGSLWNGLAYLVGCLSLSFGGMRVVGGWGLAHLSGLVRSGLGQNAT